MRDNMSMPKKRASPRVHPLYSQAFWSRIKTLRGEMTQEAVADALRIERDTYKQYEVRSMMPHHLIPRFIEAVDAGPDGLYFLFTGKFLRHDNLQGLDTETRDKA